MKVKKLIMGLEKNIEDKKVWWDEYGIWYIEILIPDALYRV